MRLSHRMWYRLKWRQHMRKDEIPASKKKKTLKEKFWHIIDRHPFLVIILSFLAGRLAAIILDVTGIWPIP